MTAGNGSAGDRPTGTAPNAGETTDQQKAGIAPRTTGEDTIVAIATPPGRGGIGVVRMSGDRAVAIAAHLIRLPASFPETQHATLGEFVDPKSGRVFDQVIVTFFRAPHSYTGEDVAEISCHGAPVVLAQLVECCLEKGARAAEPGEFTMRAFLNGRIDLTQAEAVRDLIESRTIYQVQVAAQQLDGAVSARIGPHKRALIELIARLEAGIDFAEDDLPVSGWDEIEESLRTIAADLNVLSDSYGYGRVLREGLSLAIVGRPNVGKSSLFNCLLNEERAIVTAIPGTTRDLVAESASIGGIPVRLVDTAGLRDTSDEAERIGVQKTLQAIADCDLRLLVLDVSQEWHSEDRILLERLRPLGSLLVALNKSDLPHRLGETDFARGSEAESGSAAAVSTSARPSTRPQLTTVWTSALSGEGISELKSKLLNLAAPARDLGHEAGVITSLRQQQLLRRALDSLDHARQAASRRIHHEMLLLDLYDALHALDSITGETTVEDVLGVIFSRFCVGK